jgi:predicted metal-dependent hydrolase
MTEKLKILKHSEIVLNSKVVSYTLKRSMKARCLWLRVKNGSGLIVTVPRGYNINNVDSYLYTKSRWILRALDKINSIKHDQENNPSPNTIMYLGNSLNISKIHVENQSTELIRDKNCLIVNIDSNNLNSQANQIEFWLKNQAIIYLNQRTRYFAEKMNLSYNKLSIRNQKSRWGSCSRNKNLSFNWKLIMTPEYILDYVVIHELCHLREMNHSRNFWNLVSQYCPDWKEYRKWLNKNSSYLHFSVNPEDIRDEHIS